MDDMSMGQGGAADHSATKLHDLAVSIKEQAGGSESVLAKGLQTAAERVLSHEQAVRDAMSSATTTGRRWQQAAMRVLRSPQVTRVAQATLASARRNPVATSMVLAGIGGYVFYAFFRKPETR